MKTTMLALFAAFGLATAASAAITPLPVPAGDTAIVTVGEACGPGWWRSGLDGRCRPLGPYAHGSFGYGCPAGWHIGPRGGACWPNR